MKTYEDYLAHHGILGQKWGVKNGPPYPLGSGQLSAAEKKKITKAQNKVYSDTKYAYNKLHDSWRRITYDDEKRAYSRLANINKDVSEGVSLVKDLSKEYSDYFEEECGDYFNNEDVMLKYKAMAWITDEYAGKSEIDAAKEALKDPKGDYAEFLMIEDWDQSGIPFALWALDNNKNPDAISSQLQKYDKELSSEIGEIASALLGDNANSMLDEKGYESAKYFVSRALKEKSIYADMDYWWDMEQAKSYSYDKGNTTEKLKKLLNSDYFDELLGKQASKQASKQARK